MGRMIVLVTNLHTIMYSIGGFTLVIGAILCLIGGYFVLKRRQNDIQPVKLSINSIEKKPIV